MEKEKLKYLKHYLDNKTTCAHEERKDVTLPECSENKTEQTAKPKGFWIATQQYYPVVSIEKNSALP